MSSDEVTVLLSDGGELSNDELLSLLHGSLPDGENGIEADVFTYNGRTLILAYPAEPMRDRFALKMRIKRKGRTR